MGDFSYYTRIHGNTYNLERIFMRTVQLSFRPFMAGFLLIPFLCTQLPAQDVQTSVAAQKQTVAGNLGVTVIDGKTYYLFNIMPDVGFGNWGVGLDINLRFDSEGNIRGRDLQLGKVIRYIRYGNKGDDIYGRLGMLDAARLGNGFIVNNYRNTASYDLRKTGLEFDFSIDEGGMELVYSDLGRLSLLGVRAFTRPFMFTSLDKTPLVKDIELGATYAGDYHTDANKTVSAGNVTYKNGVPTGKVDSLIDNGSLAIFGFDIGLPIISYPWIKSRLYADYAKIVDFGSGAATGIRFDISPLGLLRLGLKYERRFLGDQFLPSYFDGMYERYRFVKIDSATFTSKAQELADAKAMQANYGEVSISVLGTFTATGEYFSPVGVKNQGVFRMRLMPGQELPGGILIDAGLDKRRVGKVFVLDENALLFARIGYKLNPFTMLTLLYEWTFKEVKDANGNTIRYETQRRFEPRIGIYLTF